MLFCAMNWLDCRSASRCARLSWRCRLLSARLHVTPWWWGPPAARAELVVALGAAHERQAGVRGVDDGGGFAAGARAPAGVRVGADAREEGELLVLGEELGRGEALDLGGRELGAAGGLRAEDVDDLAGVDGVGEEVGDAGAAVLVGAGGEGDHAGEGHGVPAELAVVGGAFVGFCFCFNWSSSRRRRS